MTFCLGIRVEEGVVGIADTRVTMGSECIVAKKVGVYQFGNGSLFLQIRHDRCVNCNVCAISRVCPGDAFVRVPAEQPYLLKEGH